MDDNITSLSGKPGSPAAQAGQPVQMPVPSIQAVNQIIDEVVQSYIKAWESLNPSAWNMVWGNGRTAVTSGQIWT